MGEFNPLFDDDSSSASPISPPAPSAAVHFPHEGALPSSSPAEAAEFPSEMQCADNEPKSLSSSVPKSPAQPHHPSAEKRPRESEDASAESGSPFPAAHGGDAAKKKKRKQFQRARNSEKVRFLKQRRKERLEKHSELLLLREQLESRKRDGNAAEGKESKNAGGDEQHSPKVPKKKYALLFGYNGEGFHGLQKQLQPLETLLALQRELSTGAFAATPLVDEDATAGDEVEETDAPDIFTPREGTSEAAPEPASTAAAKEAATATSAASSAVVPLRTVEGVLEEALLAAGGIAACHVGCLQKLQWSRAARTDRGVHAACNVISLKLSLGLVDAFLRKESCLTEAADTLEFDPDGDAEAAKDAEAAGADGEKQPQKTEAERQAHLAWQRGREAAFLDRLNEALPADIKCFAVKRVTKNFDARISCSRRRYAFLLPAWLLQPVAVRRDLRKVFNLYHARSASLPSSPPLSEGAAAASASPLSAEARACLKLALASGAAEGEAAAETASAPGECGPAAGTEGVQSPSSSEKARAAEAVKAEGRFHLGERLLGGPPPVISSAALQDTAYAHRSVFEDDGHTPLPKPLSTPELAERLRAVFKVFEGTHSFQNFTKGGKNKDTSPAAFKRHIHRTSVSVTKLDGVSDDILVVELEGQSFLFNQIRKMIGVAVEVCRGTATVSSLTDSLRPNRKNVFIHTAPAEGLLLLSPVYDTYNRTRAAPPELPLIEVASLEDETSAFQRAAILPCIARSFSTSVWSDWQENINWHPFFLENISFHDARELAEGQEKNRSQADPRALRQEARM
ncbi:hypothetical protein BESB_079700 [Besnoitia besnoiti]|uniref:Pseudouridine synthase I TruA alpha/beta domain-containing protein n=1 Tax=Besnoitia besnoiti TaxID=94643 RepID=A0A2A9M977_BESBE|nr:hypothetical protein BESB_079700 [Besnoitia besnoiti]PFH33754.1 hypothetical protein BESB_079700 [Besnoitia besnoiti]